MRGVAAPKWMRCSRRTRQMSMRSRCAEPLGRQRTTSCRRRFSWPGDASISFPTPRSLGSWASLVECWPTSVVRTVAKSATPTSDHTVLAAVASLSPAERDAITLIAWDGLSADEAAIVLGCSRAAFYVRVHRARRRLAAALGHAIDPSNEQKADPS